MQPQERPAETALLRRIREGTYADSTAALHGGTGLKTTRPREDARRIIREAVGTGDDTVVRFCGWGATAAIDNLDVLRLPVPHEGASADGDQ